MKKRIPLILLLVVLVGVGVWRAAHRAKFLYAGTIEATEIDLSARLAAPIAEIFPQEGEPVGQGQVVARLDGADLRLAAEQAERDYQRGVRLHNNGSLPDENLERLRLKRDDAVLRLSWCNLSSPIEGVVLRRYREPAEWVTPGQKILTVADLRHLYAYVYVPAPVMEKLKINQPVTGVLALLEGKTISGKIVYIRNEAEFTPKNVQTRTERERLVFGVKVAFDNPDSLLKPGMSVEMGF